MKIEEITHVYQKVKTTLNCIYKKRKATLIFQRIMWIITGLYLILMLVNMLTLSLLPQENSLVLFFKHFQSTPQNPYANIYPLIGLILLLYPTIYIFTHYFKIFKIAETAAITKMIQMLFPKAIFNQSNTIPNKEVLNSKLFSWVKTDTPIINFGQIYKTINNTHINIADIGIKEKNISNKVIETLINIPLLNMFIVLYQYILKNIFTNTTTDNLYYTFRGMFCWLNYPKKLEGHTVIISNTMGKKLDRIISFNFQKEQKIRLEDLRFTNQFSVYSTNQIEARYVLSLDLMERITALKEKFKQPIMLSFQNQQMYLAVENNNGIFSFPSGKIDNIETIEKLANNIDTAFCIAQELKLLK